jgi:DNA-binding HxlR family transcriptional regulator
MRRADNRSHCPVNFALEAFGDSWSLLIIRDIVFWGKRTYSEFLKSDEAIATNVLASRLAVLEAKDIICKTVSPTDKRKEIYSLTERGLGLIPIIMEMSGWSATNDPGTTAPQSFVSYVYANRDKAFALICDTVRGGGSIFAGQDSVVRQLVAHKSGSV